MKAKRNWSVSAALACLALGLIALFCFELPIERTTYCPDCGIRREFHFGRLAGIPLKLISFERQSPTHLSELYRAAASVKAHQHRWRPSNCPVLATDISSERGQRLVNAIKASRVRTFVYCIDQFSDQPTSAKWHSLLSNAVYLEMLDGLLRFCRFPAEGFADRAEFMKWWSEHAAALYRELEITPFICC